MGVSETSVQQRGGSADDAEILVQLPGVDDPARVKQILKTQAVLELDEVKGGPFSTEQDARARKAACCRSIRWIAHEVPRGRNAAGVLDSGADPGDHRPRHARCAARAE